MLVLDASFVIAWAYKEAPISLDALIRKVTEDIACVPSHWTLEITNTLLNSERRGQLDAHQRRDILAAIRSLPIQEDAETWTRGWDKIPALAELHGLTTYDAAYLELAMRLEGPLATRDNDLAQAARKAGVPLFE